MRTEIDLNESEIDLNESEIDLNEAEIDLNEAEIDLNESKIDLNESEHFLKANLDQSEIHPSWIDIIAGIGPLKHYKFKIYLKSIKPCTSMNSWVSYIITPFTHYNFPIPLSSWSVWLTDKEHSAQTNHTHENDNHKEK